MMMRTSSVSGSTRSAPVPPTRGRRRLRVSVVTRVRAVSDSSKQEGMFHLSGIGFFRNAIVWQGTMSVCEDAALTDRTLYLDTLVVLAGIAETGSLTRRRRGAGGGTQQAVSAALRVAERATGQPLVHRRHPVQLTDVGRVVLGLAVPVLETSRRLDAGIVALRELVVPSSCRVTDDRGDADARLAAGAPDAARCDVRLLAGNSAAVTDLVRSVRQISASSRPPSTHRTSPRWWRCGRARGRRRAAPSVAHVPRRHRERLADTPLLLREEGSGTTRHIGNLAR